MKPDNRDKAARTVRTKAGRADRKQPARKTRRTEDQARIDTGAAAWLARRHAETAISEARRVLAHAQRALESAEQALARERVVARKRQA